jgi:hypothetical protein
MDAGAGEKRAGRKWKEVPVACSVVSPFFSHER